MRLMHSTCEALAEAVSAHLPCLPCQHSFPPLFLYPVFHHMMLLFLIRQSPVKIFSHCICDVCLWLLWAEPCAPGKLPRALCWNTECVPFASSKELSWLCAWSTGLKLQAVGSRGCRVLCVGGDHGLTWELWDPLHQPAARRASAWHPACSAPCLLRLPKL